MHMSPLFKYIRPPATQRGTSLAASSITSASQIASQQPDLHIPTPRETGLALPSLGYSLYSTPPPRLEITPGAMLPSSSLMLNIWE